MPFLQRFILNQRCKETQTLVFFGLLIVLKYEILFSLIRQNLKEVENFSEKHKEQVGGPYLCPSAGPTFWRSTVTNSKLV